MSIYYYKAKDRSGRLVTGRIDAVSVEIVANLLNEKQLIIIEIIPQAAIPWLEKFFTLSSNRVKSKELVVFFRQLSVMIEASLPLVRALRILIRQTPDNYLKTVIAYIADEVDGGSSLSAALANFPRVFSKFYVNIIHSGETSGRLSEVLNYLADQQEKDYDLESKIKGAMIYPVFVVAVLLVVGALVMIFILPQINGIIEEAGAPVPFLTRALIAISMFLFDYWWLLMIAVSGAALAFIWAVTKTVFGRRSFDLFKIKVPVFGRIFKTVYIVRLCRSFSTLLKGGVPAAQALLVVREVVDNRLFEELIDATVKEVDEGNPMSEIFSQSPYLPLLVSQMISVGEETGRLEEVLDKITDFYSREINNSMQNLTTLMEPVIIVILGVAVALFVIAVILPMWQLSSAF